MMRVYIKCRFGGRLLISVEECCAAGLKSIDFSLMYSEEEFLKNAARLKNEEKIQLKVKATATAE